MDGLCFVLPLLCNLIGCSVVARQSMSGILPFFFGCLALKWKSLQLVCVDGA